VPDSSVSLDAIPEELRSLDQWVVWKYEVVGKRRTKVPYSPKVQGKASATNPKTWATFAKAVAVAHDYDGIGVVLTADDPFVGLDLDGCLTKDGELHKAAAELVSRFASYTERTPSEVGLRIIVRGRIESGRSTRTVPWAGFVKDKDAELAIYGDGRYFAVTGDVSGFTEVEERQDELDLLGTEYFSGSSGPVDFTDVLEQVELGADEPAEQIENLCSNSAKFREWWEKNPNDQAVDGSQRDYNLALHAFIEGSPVATVAAILEHSRDDDAHGRNSNQSRFRTWLARTIAKAQQFALEVRRYRVTGVGKNLMLPDRPERDDLPANLKWLTSVFNLDPEKPIIRGEWQGLRGPRGHIVLYRMGADYIRFEPATQLLTPAKLIESLAFERDHSDGPIHTYLALHAREIADVAFLVCDASRAISDAEQFFSILSTYMQGSDPVTDCTTYGTAPQRFEAMQLLRGYYSTDGRFVRFGSPHERRYLIDVDTGELVVRASDLTRAARDYIGGSLKHGWLDALVDSVGWARVEIQGYAESGREGRKGEHVSTIVYRGHPQ
jgi:hypothetical protein